MLILILFFFFFNDTATTEIYTLSLHDALPISSIPAERDPENTGGAPGYSRPPCEGQFETVQRSEEHTSELQSQSNLVCRLLLEKKKKNNKKFTRKHHHNNATERNLHTLYSLSI